MKNENDIEDLLKNLKKSKKEVKDALAELKSTIDKQSESLKSIRKIFEENPILSLFDDKKQTEKWIDQIEKQIVPK